MNNIEGERTEVCQGIVINISSKVCQVMLLDRVVNCVVPSLVVSQRNALAVGDHVKLAMVASNQYKLVEVLPRVTSLYRGSRRSQGHEILVAANVEYLLAIVTADYFLHQAGFLESALIAARRAGISAVLFISKWDLISVGAQTLLREKLSLYSSLAAVVVGSAAEASEELVRTLQGKVTVVMGDRACGKTTLIQGILSRMQGKNLAQEKLPSTHSSVMHMGPAGMLLIDTPGVRDLAITPVSEEERDLVFPEITALAEGCQFRNCTHVHEGGCQVISALRVGTIRRERYDAYQGETDIAPKCKHKEKDSSPKVDYRLSSCPESFYCKKCGEPVAPAGAGTEHRNHCPKCLASVHVDERPGDRSSLCHGLMEPVSVWVRSGGEWAIIHRCKECGALSSNRIAADDNPMLLMSLAVRPLSMPPFPLNTLASQF